uniref:Uncharacterized protein n=2 Tax=Acidianus TaxID=12914 RepID=A0A2U9IQ77_9CREN
MEILKFTEAIKSAKQKSPQTFIFHSMSVGTLALAICEEINNVNGADIKRLEEIYNVDYRTLCYFAGFFHDWMKLFSEEKNGKIVFDKEILQKGIEIAKRTGLPIAESLINRIATFAEGELQSLDELPLWIAVKIADMLMISDIKGVTDVFKYANKPIYKDAIREMEKNYNIRLNYIKSSDRLFTLLASEDIVKKFLSRNVRFLISYKDGIIYLTSKENVKIGLKDIYDALRLTLHGEASSHINELAEDIEKCIRSEESEWLKVAINNDYSVFYKDGKPKQLNVFFPTLNKKCRFFDDIVGLLSPEDKIKVAEKVIRDLAFGENVSGEKVLIPHAVLAYFIEKFSRKDKDYIRRALGINKKFPYYIQEMGNNVTAYLEKLLEVLKSGYSSNGEPEDKTLLAFVKKSFEGNNLVDDLPPINETPKNYCIVCGMPIYDNPVSFGEFGALLKKGGKEIWIPREKGLEDIDAISKKWAICPICHYEAIKMKNEISPPYLIVSFYPGIPIDLMNMLDFDPSKIVDFNDRDNTLYDDIMHDRDFKKIFEDSGGSITNQGIPTTILRPDYLGSKIVISLDKLASTRKDTEMSTRITKSDLNKALRIAPLMSIVYLGAPIFISTNIYDFPILSKNITISSDINYGWMQAEDNLSTLLLLLSYRIKYYVFVEYFGKKKRKKLDGEEIENYLNSMVNEMDLFSSVDKSLAIVSLGVSIDESLGKRFTFFVPFLKYALEKVSHMGEALTKSLNTLAYYITKIVNDPKSSKYGVVGFLRDGRDVFFKLATASNKEDRITLATGTAITSLQNKYNIDEDTAKKLYFVIRDIFTNLYEIEEKTDMSLAISISDAIINTFYIFFLSYMEKGDKNE